MKVKKKSKAKLALAHHRLSNLDKDLKNESASGFFFFLNLAYGFTVQNLKVYEI